MSDILVFITIVINAVLGLLIYFRSRKAGENFFYALFVAFLDLWILTNFLENEPDRVGLERLDLFLRLDFVFGALFMYSWLRFCVALASRAEYHLRWGVLMKWVTRLTTVAFIPLILFTPFVIKDIQFYDSVIHFKDGPLFIFYALFILACTIIGPFILFRVRRFVKGKGDEALGWSIGLILTGFLISLGTAVTINLLQPILSISLEVSRIGIYGLSILVATTAYAIIRHQFLSVKVIATEAFTVILWIILFSRMIVEQSLEARIVDGSIALASVVFGILLIGSVRQEVHQREELQRLAEELKVANLKLEKLSKFKTQLLALASHQIKSPLAVIKGFVAILLEGLYGPLSDKAKDALVKMKTATDDLIGLINMLLDLRQVEEGKITYEFARVDLKKIVQGEAVLLEPLARDKGLKFEFVCDRAEAWVRADAQKLTQVIQNLVDNAIKYTPAGFVRLDLKLAEGLVAFEVSDSGLGISPALLPQLFEEFVRDERVKKEIRGTGLGLYIARKIVEAHNGKIWAESDGAGKGSRFYLQLKNIV